MLLPPVDVHATLTAVCGALLADVNELFPDHTRVYQWFAFCAKGTPFPLPNAAPGAALDELLITFSNQMWTGNCEAFGAMLADNYTEVDNGGAVVNRVGAIKACTSAVGTMMLSGEPMGPTVVSGNTAVVMNHGAVYVRDPVTTKQCGLQCTCLVACPVRSLKRLCG